MKCTDGTILMSFHKDAMYHMLSEYFNLFSNITITVFSTWVFLVILLLHTLALELHKKKLLTQDFFYLGGF